MTSPVDQARRVTWRSSRRSNALSKPGILGPCPAGGSRSSALYKRAGSEQRKRDIQVIELAGPGVGDDEIKPSVAKTRGERGAVRDVKANACISPEVVAASNIDPRPVERVVPPARKMAIAEQMNRCPAVPNGIAPVVLYTMLERPRHTITSDEMQELQCGEPIRLALLQSVRNALHRPRRQRLGQATFAPRRAPADFDHVFEHHRFDGVVREPRS